MSVPEKDALALAAEDEPVEADDDRWPALNRSAAWARSAARSRLAAHTRRVRAAGSDAERTMKGHTNINRDG